MAMAVSPDQTFAEAQSSTACRCGRDKKTGDLFCHKCYSHVPKAIGYRVRAEPGYLEALAYFKARPHRKTWKAFSIPQPWAYLTVHGLRKWDSRSYSVEYRGPVAIASGMAATQPEKFPEWFRDALAEVGIARGMEYAPAVAVGKVLAVAELVEIMPADKVPAAEQDVYTRFEPGRWAWRFENIRLLDEMVPSTLKTTTGNILLPVRR